MATSSRASKDPVPEAIAGFLWSLWAELGVPGWTQNHEAWWVDPEALLLATAATADLDARLREEAAEWAVRYARLLSAGRFKAFMTQSPRLAAEATAAPGAALLATIQRHTSLRLPAGGEAVPLSLRRRSLPLTVDRPAQLSLKLRAIYGVGGRAETLRAFLLGPPAGMTPADLRDAGLGFSKRALQFVLDDLVLGGVLWSRKRGSTAVYSLTEAAQLVAPASLPSQVPRWLPLFEVVEALAGMGPPSGPVKTRALTLRATARSLDGACELAGFAPPPHAVRGDDFVAAFAEWRSDLVTELAAGKLPGRERRG